jgi:hypothetical protein
VIEGGRPNRSRPHPSVHHISFEMREIDEYF